ncbi:MAG: ABC transporter ATP-binding protein [Opitutae bacterium]|nr:ABC transporter ATP-binding protein [Opitutae bacterium]
MLELRGLKKRYYGRRDMIMALDGVSLQIERGMLHALHGSSGCGKTTLLLAAGGLLAPDAGRVLLDGRDLYAMTAEDRSKIRSGLIGFVFQQFHLIPYLSVLDNLRAAALARGDHSPEKTMNRALELTEHFGLASRRDHLPYELSTGERQRTALARALMNRPLLVLADEPTGNLDAENADIVLKALEQFAAEGGAVLMASHDLRVAKSGHLIWRMSAGRLEHGDNHI